MAAICKYLLAVFLAVISGLSSLALADDQKPNVLWIVVDDQGWADLGFQEKRNLPIETPNLDKLAASGIVLSDAYACAPICSPSRAGMLLGNYPQFHGYYDNWDSQIGLPADAKIAPAYFNKLGYRTAAFGKWHLGWQEHNHPRKLGFDYHYGFTAGQHDYFLTDTGHTWYGGPMSVNSLEFNGERVKEREIPYMTDLLTDETIKFIQSTKNQPFFAYLAYTVVHAPHQAKREHLEHYANKEMTENRKVVRAMYDSLDENIGKLVQALRKEKKLKNTLIIYTSDNGGLAFRAGADNGPLKGSKGYLSEGGIRVPMIMSWADKLPKGKVYRQPVINIDMLPTSLAAVGAPQAMIQECGGVNLMPYLLGVKKGMPRESLHWQMGELPRKRWAVRKGKWKLVQARNVAGLYDLEADIAEAKDLSDQYPEKVQELQASHDAWNKMLKPSKVTTETRNVGLAELLFRREWTTQVPRGKRGKEVLSEMKNE